MAGTIARSLPRPGGARLRPSRCRVRLRVPRRPRSFTITWTKEMLPQCPQSMLTTLSDMFIFYLYLYYLVSTYVLTPMTIPCDIPDQIGAVAAISDFCDNRCYGDPRSWLGAGRENTQHGEPATARTDYRVPSSRTQRRSRHRTPSPVGTSPPPRRSGVESAVVLGVVLVGGCVLRWRAGAAGRGATNNGNCAPIIVFVTAVGIPA